MSAQRSHPAVGVKPAYVCASAPLTLSTSVRLTLGAPRRQLALAPAHAYRTDTA